MTRISNSTVCDASWRPGWQTTDSDGCAVIRLGRNLIIMDKEWAFNMNPESENGKRYRHLHQWGCTVTLLPFFLPALIQATCHPTWKDRTICLFYANIKDSSSSIVLPPLGCSDSVIRWGMQGTEELYWLGCCMTIICTHSITDSISYWRHFCVDVMIIPWKTIKRLPNKKPQAPREINTAIYNKKLALKYGDRDLIRSSHKEITGWRRRTPALFPPSGSSIPWRPVVHLCVCFSQSILPSTVFAAVVYWGWTEILSRNE